MRKEDIDHMTRQLRFFRDSFTTFPPAGFFAVGFFAEALPVGFSIFEIVTFFFATAFLRGFLTFTSSNHFLPSSPQTSHPTSPAWT